MNNHNELDTVCRRYNAVFGVHNIESRCEARYSKCFEVFTANAMYIRPILFTLKHICSEPLIRKEDLSIMLHLVYCKKNLGENYKKIHVLFFKISTHLVD